MQWEWDDGESPLVVTNCTQTTQSHNAHLAHVEQTAAACLFKRSCKENE